MKHELVVLADKIDWAWLDEQWADCFFDKGRPAEPVRFMIGMFLLKHTFGLSDEQVSDRWVHDPYSGRSNRLPLAGGLPGPARAQTGLARRNKMPEALKMLEALTLWA